MTIADLFNNRYQRYLLAGDVAYNDKSDLDIYAIEKQTTTPRPVIILWHGGSWVRGDKAIYRYVADYLARRTGALIVVPNYQHYPNVKYPFFIDEGWQVVQWLQKNAFTYDADLHGYSVVGSSAGAHTACAIALGFRKPNNLPTAQKCVSLAGPNYKVERPYWPVFDMASTDKTRFPNHFVSLAANIPATKWLIVHGTRDRIVDPRQSEIFAVTLKKAGADVSVLRPRIGHIGLIIRMGSPFASWTLYARQVVHFLKSE